MAVRATILNEIRTVAKEKNVDLGPLTDDLVLQDSGFDSLSFAILYSRLEDITGRDPLSSGDFAKYPRTVGELIELYENRG
jgi:acyl carrier protein